VRILIDESLPVQLATELNLQNVKTVAGVGLRGFKNGALLERAVALGFTILITADQKLEHQQDLRGFSIAVIVLRARSNRMEHLRPLIPQVRQAVTVVTIGQVLRLGV
jgi:predicted nuclease of predicted toxin-antitoxin system